MELTRRDMIAAAAAATMQSAAAATPALPARNEFAVVKSEVCLNNARWHPISVGATRAVAKYLEYKAGGGGDFPDYGSELQTHAKTQFAALIHAKPSEIRSEERRVGK